LAASQQADPARSRNSSGKKPQAKGAVDNKDI
jgi:tetratricopeptide (TPR) repeat protein